MGLLRSSIHSVGHMCLACSQLWGKAWFYQDHSWSISDKRCLDDVVKGSDKQMSEKLQRLR